MSPAAGPLRHRVRIEERAEGVDDFGQPLDDWTTVATVWAAVEDARGREIFETSNQVLVNEVTTNVRIRYRAGIRPEMRAVDVCPASAGCSGRTFDISNVRDMRGRRRELVLEAVERFVASEVET